MRGFRLEVRGFGPIVEHSSLTVNPGSLLVCFGPSGSGKSLVSRLVYALASLPLKLAGDEWGEAVRRALYEVFGDYWESLFAGATVAVKGVGSSLYIRGGEVNASFDKRVVGGVVGRDERVAAAKAKCREPRVSRLYGSIEECLETVEELWKSAIRHELLLGGVVGYTVHAETGLPLEPMSVFLGYARSAAMLLTGQKFDLLGFVMRLEPPLRVLVGDPLRLVYGVDGDLVEEIGGYDWFSALIASKLLLGARLILEKRDGQLIARLVGEGYEAPMHSAAAAVAEATPLLALVARVFREWRGGRGLVVIEEPETQLHPDLQRLVFWLLLRLAAEGHTVIATTHSPFIAAEARIALLLGEMRGDRRMRAAERVAASLFNDAAAAEWIARLGGEAPERVKIVVFGEDGFKEAGRDEFISSTPWIAEIVERQSSLVIDLVDELGEQEG